MADIVGIGASTLDLLNLVESFPTSDMNAESLHCEFQGGGPVSTAIAVASSLGSSCAMVDVLGDDWRSRLIFDAYNASGVDTRHLVIQPGTESSFSNILVRRHDGARCIYFRKATSRDLSIEDLPKETIRGAKILHLNGRHLAAATHCAKIARKNGVLVSFDGGAGRYRPELDDLIEFVDILIVAQEFAERFTGLSDSRQAGDQLSKGRKIAGITNGKNGSWIFSEQGHFHVPAYPAEVVDTTGCGDTYHGAFLHGLSEGLSLKACAEIASKAGAIAAQHFGGRGAFSSTDFKNIAET